MTNDINEKWLKAHPQAHDIPCRDLTLTGVAKNDGKTTWNDPDRGTLQFALPAAAQGKVEVNVLAPGGMPIRRAPDPGSKANTFKLDFPIKPGESRIDMSWAMPFSTPRLPVRGSTTSIDERGSVASCTSANGPTRRMMRPTTPIGDSTGSPGRA